MKRIRLLLPVILLAALALARAADADESGWRLISIPCHTGTEGPGAYLAPAPGYVFAVDGANGYVIPDSSMTPGRAYWMYFESEPHPQAGCMTISYSSVEITLEPGWNLVGNPFIHDVALGGDWSEAYEYDYTTGEYRKVSVLKPWRGYFIKAPASCAGGCAFSIENPAPGSMAGRADEPRLPRIVNCPASGDTDGNKLVDAGDLFPITQNYGTAVTSSTALSIARADTDGNGIIDASDLFAVSRNYGDTCEAGMTNSIPVALAQSVTAAENTATVITLSATDANDDDLTYAIVSSPLHGNLDTSSIPTVVYTSELGFTGEDSFTFKASDGVADSLSAVITITVEEATVSEVTGIEVTSDPNRRFSSLLVSWDPPSDTSVNAFDIYCNSTLVNACPLRLECFYGMNCDPEIVYTYSINVPNLAGAPADPSSFSCDVQIQAFTIDDTANLIAAQSRLTAAVAASTFAHTADSPYAGGTTKKEGAPTDCSAIRNSQRASAAGGSTVVLANARIQAWRKESSSESPNGTLVDTVYSNDEGYYEFSSLDPGYYNFIAYHDNGTTQTDDDIYSMLESINIQPAPFNEGGFNDLGDMKLEETGSIYGQVKLALDSTGDSLLTAPDDAYMGIDVYIPGTSFTAKTNRSGEFYILYLPPATYSIVAVADNYALVQRDGIQVESKQITTVTPDLVLLSSIGSVVGTAAFADSSNDGDASVALEMEGDSSVVETTSTLTDGSFTFTGLATGTYTLTINRYGWQPYTQTGVQVLSNTTTDLGAIGPIARIPGPAITSVDPTSGDNDTNTTITITGSNFASTTVFYIEKGLLESKLQSISFASGTQMTAVVPSGYDWGTYDITAVNPDTQSVTLSEVYSVTLPAPSISSISPVEMDNSASVEATITGGGFVDGSAIRIGTTLTSNTTVSAGGATITTTIPAGIPAGVYDVSVTNPDSAARSASLESEFTSKALFLIEPDPYSDATLSFPLGTVKTFTATCSFTDGTTTTQTDCSNNVQWYSSNPAAGTITLMGGEFETVAAGTTVVTAQRGTVSSSDVAIAVYDPVSIFLDTGQRLYETKNHQANSVAGDFNGDGYIDLVSSNSGYGRAYLNNGSGTLAHDGSTNACYVSEGFSALDAADFDGDGDLDVVCLWYSAGYGSGILGNNGDASSWIGGLGGYANGIQATSIAVADFNMDGRPDWAVGNPDGGNVVLFANSDGTSTSSGQSLGSYNTGWLAAGDVDGDGDSDLVDGVADGANHVWLNNGSGSFTDSGLSFGTGSTRFLLLSDFDADGDLDVYEGTGGASEYDKVWLNDGSGAFTEKSQSFVDMITNSAAAADVDNDGDFDVIAGVALGGYDVVYLNDGSAGFSDSRQTFEPNYTNSIGIGDFNGDNDVDMAVAALSGIRIYNGGNGGVPANTRPAAPAALSASVIDVDGDNLYNDVTLSWNAGADDETPAALITYNLNIYRSDGFTISSTNHKFGPGHAGSNLSVTLRNLPDGYFTWRVQSVDSAYMKSEWSVPANFTTGMIFTEDDSIMSANDTGAVMVADLDADGDFDIIEGRDATGGGLNAVWTNNGSAAFTEASSFGTADTKALVAADVDGDGDADALEASSGDSAVWLNNGFGGFSDSGEYIGGTANGLTPLDADNDGDIDILSVTNSGYSYIYRNDGSGGFSVFSYIDSMNGQAADAADVTGDGLADVALAAGEDGMILYKNEGEGVFSELDDYVAFGEEMHTSDVVIADINDDAAPDYLIKENDDYVRALVGKGYGVSFPWYSNANAISPGTSISMRIATADIDVDGDRDVVSFSFNQAMDILLFDYYDPGSARPYFNYVNQASLPFVAAVDGAIADFDGDVDQDILIAVADGMNNSNDMILFNTQVKTNTAPSQPSGLDATEDSEYMILSWDQGADTESSISSLNYEIKVQNSDDGSWLVPQTFVPGGYNTLGATHSIILHHIPAVSYDWYVRTVDPGGLTSSWVSGPSFTPTADSTAPSFAGIDVAEYSQVTGLTELLWTAATDDSTPVVYNIYEANTPGGQNFSAPTYSTYQTSVYFSDLTDYQQYCYVVRAQDSANPPNEDTNTHELCVTIDPDYDAPVFSGLTSAVTGSELGSVDLAWTAATDDNGPVTYNIYYATSSMAQNFAVPNKTSTSDTGTTVGGLSPDYTYYFVVRAQDATFSASEDTNTVELSADPAPVPQVLLVDADSRYWESKSYEDYMIDALDSNGITYYHFDKRVGPDSMNYVPEDLLNAFLDPNKIVIWLAGNNYSLYDMMDETEEMPAVMEFLDNGGRLMITGMNAAGTMNNASADIWTQGYFGISGPVSYAYDTTMTVTGVASDPVGDGISLSLPYYSGDGAQNQSYAYYPTVTTGTVCMTHENATAACIRYESGGYRTVFLSFGFEGIDTQADRDAALLAVFNWLTQ